MPIDFPHSLYYYFSAFIELTLLFHARRLLSRERAILPRIDIASSRFRRAPDIGFSRRPAVANYCWVYRRSMPAMRLCHAIYIFMTIFASFHAMMRYFYIDTGAVIILYARKYTIYLLPPNYRLTPIPETFSLLMPLAPSHTITHCHHHQHMTPAANDR